MPDLIAFALELGVVSMGAIRIDKHGQLDVPKPGLNSIFLVVGSNEVEDLVHGNLRVDSTQLVHQ